MLRKNDIIRLEITSLTSLGSGVGRYMNFVVFVSKTAPGDIIDARIIKTNKSYSIGIIEKIIMPSSYRIEADCKVFRSCGGCNFRHIAYDEELRQKLSWVNADLRNIAHSDYEVKEIIGAEKLCRYRNKAQYPVEMKDGKLFAGFYAFKSHRIVPCNDCILEPEEFSKIIRIFKMWAEKFKVTTYDESSNTGLLRHIYIRKAFATGEIMVMAVINGDSIPYEKYLVSLLTLGVGNIKSIGININRQETNTVLGKETKIIWGSAEITDKLLGRSFIISPESFYQVNHDMCEVLYSKVREFASLNGSETVIDFYCGAGTIGLTLADNAKKIIGIEITPQAINNARENAKINSIENAEFICADAKDGAEILKDRGEKCDIAIVDPPRKGCQKEVLDIIEGMGASRIVYVSCNSATFARDIALLNEKGYTIQNLIAVDLFPRTANVECIGLMSKA